MMYDTFIHELTKGITLPELPSRFSRVIVGGMGGSALPAHALRFLAPALPLYIHSDYGLPEDATADDLFVAISYSGNTEETLSFAQEAKERALSLVCISGPGTLLQIAKEYGVPVVELEGGHPPRNVVPYMLRALLLVMGHTEYEQRFASVAFSFDDAEAEAQQLSDSLKDSLPLFYASRRNGFLPRLAKVFWNESVKVPAFANIFPELNHNEMQAFDASSEGSAPHFHFVLLTDEADDERIRHRMDVFAQLMQERGHAVTRTMLSDESRETALLRAYYVYMRAAELSAKARGIDPDAVPLIEAFKQSL